MQNSRIISDVSDLPALHRFLDARKIPFTIAIADGKKRTNPQNKLQRKWMQEVAEQLQDETAEYYRGWCKLHIGVGILKPHDDLFSEEYDRVIKPMPYETKLALMMEPFDFGVTRRMKSKQKTEYLDAVRVHFEGLGVKLTIPVTA